MCKSEFCGLCMKIPYHLGYTCDEFEAFEKCKKCIYCETPIPMNKSSMTESIANKEIINLLNGEGFDTSSCIEKTELLSLWKLFLNVCSAVDCKQRVQIACTRVLDCGHRCGGVRDENRCLPCMEVCQ
jgi:E3 ubiquitin-protein ligase MYCBP2